MSKWLKLGTLAALLAVVALVAVGAVAWAQGPTPQPPTTQPPTSQPPTSQPPSSQQPTFGPGMGRGFGMGGMMGGGMMGGAQNSLVSVAAKVLGMTQTDLLTALKDKSIAEVAKAKGVALDKIVNEFLAPWLETMNSAVKAGRMTQAQVDTALETMKKQIDERLNEKFTPGQGGPDGDCPMFTDTNNDGICDTCPMIGGQGSTNGQAAPGMMGGRGMRGRWSD